MIAQVTKQKLHHEDKNYAKFMDISPEVREALEQNKPIVALESTIITHGRGMEYPQNKTTAESVEDVVRKNGAVPATIAILEGRIKIGQEVSLEQQLGLTPEELEKLSQLGTKVKKCSRRDLAYIIATKSNGSTTVAATMILAHFAGIKVFVTGGIGGVHRGAEETFDISADLVELGITPVAVVCAGCKSILDIPKTLEMLETLGVAVVGLKTSRFPEFFFTEGECPVSARVDSEKECAQMIKTSFVDLGLKNGIIVANPVPKEEEANPKKVKECIEQALKEMKQGYYKPHYNYIRIKNITGQEVTPFLLKRVNELSGGDSSKSNVALIKNNAAVGAKISVELYKLINSNQVVQSF